MSTEDRGDSFAPTELDKAMAEVPPQEELKDVPPAAEDPPAAEEPAAEEPARDDKGRFTGKGVIPVDRHEAVLSKERAARELAERQLQELQSQMSEVSKSADVEKLREQATELRKAERRAIMSGDEDKSIQLSAEIDRIHEQINIAQNQSMNARAKEEAREEIRVELAVEKLQEIYPQLDENSELHDQDMVDEVLEAQKYYIAAQRMSPSKALMKAAERVFKERQPAVAADEEGKKGLAAAAKGTTDRKSAAVARNVDAAKRQPPDSRDVGMDSDKAGIKGAVDVRNLSYSEFEALPESTKARLRGDLV